MKSKNKVVINNIYGGFSLSDEATELLLKKRGIKYIKKEGKKCVGPLYLRKDIAATKRYKDLVDREWHTLTPEDRRFLSSAYIDEDDFERHDPDLVAVVEELGDDASGRFAKLEIVEINGNKYRIDKYDGLEMVETPDDIKWEEIK